MTSNSKVCLYHHQLTAGEQQDGVPCNFGRLAYLDVTRTKEKQLFHISLI